MFRVIIATLFTVSCYGVPLHDQGLTLGALDYGGYAGLGLDNGLGLAHAGYAGGAHVNAAILSHRSINVIPVPSHYGAHAPTVIDIDSSEQPVHLNFNSRSSHLVTTQGHHGQPGSIQQTSSHDEPHILRHEVTRPVIQEIHEVIVPSRNIIQEIQPVIENVETRVAKGEGKGLVGGIAGSLGITGGLGLGGGIGYGGDLGLAGGLGLGGKGLVLGGVAAGLSKGY